MEPNPRPTPVRRFGRELARVRRDSGLTQASLANRLGCSSSLVAHVEIGDRTPRMDFATRCDQTLDTNDLFQRLCRNITSPSSPDWYIRWSSEIEPRAHTLRTWDPILIPGLLQTEDYARALFQGDLPGASDSEVENGVSARLQRTKILDRETPPRLWVLLDEWAIRRPIGGAGVMRDQLDHLVTMASRPNVTVQLVPFDSPCTAGFLSSFIIAELADAPTVVSVESAGRGEVSAEQEIVAMMWSRCDRLRAEAYRPGQSLDLIKEAREQWTCVT
jgi:transcriptional regulator with XRE-family HTH domain